MMNKTLFKDEDLLQRIAEAFQNRSKLDTGDVKILTKGYPLVVLHNFLDSQFAHDLKSTVEKLPFRHKATDLFDFYQSPDLKPFLSEDTNAISRVCREIFSPNFTGAIGKIIGRQLGTEIDFAAQKYEKGQYLLCHDDRLDSRRVAFVLYLVDEAWTPEDGGQFEKYGLDHKGAPSVEPVEAFTPCWNTLVFFEVSMWSHHQVAEVLGSLPRLSVAGWLHDLKEESREPVIVQTGIIDLPIAIPKQDLLACDWEEIRTVSSRYKWLKLSDSLPWLLNLTKPINLGLDPRLDLPTWPVCIKLDSSSYFDASVSCGAEEVDRLYLVHLVESPSPVLVNNTELLAGQTFAFIAKAEHARITIRHELEGKQAAYIVYWSFLVKA